MWQRTLLSLLVAAALFSACLGSEKLEPYYDLVERFDSAVVRSETRSIAFGTPQGRRHLAKGWGHDETFNDRPFVTVTAAAALVRFHLFEPRSLDLVVTCRFRGGLGPFKRAVAVELNGEPLEPAFISKQLKAYTISATAAQTRSGDNLLTFLPGAEPSPVGEPAPPRLSCHRIDFGSQAVEAAVPLADGRRNFVFLPTGTELGYLLFLEEGSRWLADRVVLRGTDTRLEVLIETDEEGIQPLAVLDPYLVSTPFTDLFRVAGTDKRRRRWVVDFCLSVRGRLAARHPGEARYHLGGELDMTSPRVIDHQHRAVVAADRD